jgi:hypothetical protein
MNEERTQMDVASATATALPASQVTVARYDDDYPLLYGEPARQPAWPARRRSFQLSQHGAARPPGCASTCRSCGKCR